MIYCNILYVGTLSIHLILSMLSFLLTPKLLPIHDQKKIVQEGIISLFIIMGRPTIDKFSYPNLTKN